MKNALTLTLLLILVACQGVTESRSEQTLDFELSTKRVKSEPEVRANLTISEIKVFVRKVRFHAISGRKDKFKEGPFEVVFNSRSLNSAAVSQHVVSANTFDRLIFRIKKPKAEDVVVDREFRDADGSYSMIIKGDIDRIPFVHKVTHSFKEELHFDPLLVGNGSSSYTSNLLLNSDDWFYNTKKQKNLDPTNADHKKAIARAIRASFKELKGTKISGSGDGGGA